MPDIDALIANFPNQIQRNALIATQTGLDQQNLQQNALAIQQNAAGDQALKQIYSSPNAFNKQTGLPNTQALGPLASANPQMYMNMLGTMGKISDAQSRANLTNLKINDEYNDIIIKNVADPVIQYNQELEQKGIAPEQRQIMVEQKKKELLDQTQAQYGLPDSIKNAADIPFDNTWEFRSDAAKQRKTILPNSEQIDTYTDSEGKVQKKSFVLNAFGNPVDINTKLPYVIKGTVTKEGTEGKGTGSSKPAAAKMMYIPQADNTTKPELVTPPSIAGQPWTDQNGNPVKAPVGEVPVSSPDYTGAQPAQPSGNSKLTGEEYLKTVPDDKRSLVKAVAEGRMPLPTWALRDPTWKQIISDAAQYDPTFDASNFNRRNKAYMDFTSGIEGRSATAINTALGHAASLWHTSDDLAKSEWFNGQLGPWVNKTQQLFSGANPELKGKLNQFNLNANALADELERAWRGVGGSQKGIDEWRATFNTADTPDAVKASIKKAVDLLASREDSLNTQFKKAVGPRADLLDLFSPLGRKTFQAFEDNKIPPSSEEIAKDAYRGALGQNKDQTPEQNTDHTKLVGKSFDSPDAFKASIPEGKTVTLTNGEKWRKQNGIVQHLVNGAWQ